MPWTSECIHLLMTETHILRTNQCDLRDKSFTLKCQTAFTPTKLMVLLLCASWLLNVIDHHCNRQHAKPINMCANAVPTHTHTHTKKERHTNTSTNNTKWDRTSAHWIFQRILGGLSVVCACEFSANTTMLLALAPIYRALSTVHHNGKEQAKCNNLSMGVANGFSN